MSLACLDLHKLIFWTFYYTFLISPKREIDETVNFRNFHKFFTNKLSAFYGILALHFQTGQAKEVSDKAHEAMAVTCNYSLGKFTDNQNEEDVLLLSNSFLGVYNTLFQRWI